MFSQIVKASEVLNVTVKNFRDEDLGKIEEIMLDKVSGEVSYLVLSFGGFLGLGDKLFAIPWDAIHYNNEKNCFIMDISKDRLKEAPGFAKDTWPDFADHTWGESIHSFYGTRAGSYGEHRKVA